MLKYHYKIQWVIIVSILVNLPALAATDITYSVSFDGVSDRKLLSEIMAISDTISLKGRPPASINQLRRRVEGDIPNYLKLLKSKGYYGATVGTKIDSKSTPVKITFKIDTGPLYTLKSVEFEIIGDPLPDGVHLPELKTIGLSSGSSLEAQAVLNAQKALVRELRHEGFPFANVEKHKAIIDHQSRSASLTIWINPGPRALFGNTTIEGLKTIDEAFVLSNLPWKLGDRYDAKLYTEARKPLINLGIFATVRITEGENLNEKGQIPITLAVTERKHRSIGFGASYRTDEGPGFEAEWEHRNLLKKGERLQLSTTISDFTLDMESIFRKPRFYHKNQSLQLSFRLADDQPDAFRSRSLSGSGTIERSIRKGLLVGGGLAYKASAVEQLDEEESFNLLSTPLYLDGDWSNDLLDPSFGGRLGLKLTPYADIAGDGITFIKSSIQYRHYLEVLENPGLVLAGRVALGALGGAETDEIPADERFYAGGGGSIRGYAYQSVGPLSSGVPIGGRSLMELSLEARMKVTDRFGLVGFFDGGTAFSDKLFGSDENILWGAGLGLRYFTPVGPLRLDVGIPLDRREGIDDSYQIYISLGQAF